MIRVSRQWESLGWRLNRNGQEVERFAWYEDDGRPGGFKSVPTVPYAAKHRAGN